MQLDIEEQVKSFKEAFYSKPPEGADGLDLMFWMKRKDQAINTIAYNVMFEAMKELDNE